MRESTSLQILYLGGYPLKNLLVVVALFAVLLVSFAVTSSPVDAGGGVSNLHAPCGTVGDIKSDRQIDWQDVNMVTRYLADGQGLTKEQIRNADVTGDGLVDHKDVVAMAQYIGKEKFTFPACLIVQLKSTSIMGVQGPIGQPSPQKAIGEIEFFLLAQDQTLYVQISKGIALGTNAEFLSWTIDPKSPVNVVNGFWVIPPHQSVLMKASGTLITKEEGLKNMQVKSIRWSTRPTEPNVYMRHKVAETSSIYLYPPAP